MIPTDELRLELREMLDEVIPEGGKDSDTAFSDKRIDSLLAAAPNIYSAAAEGWRRKAAMIQKRLGDITSYQNGDERYEYVNLTTALNAALNMAKTYDEMASRQTAGSFLLRVRPPEVL